MEKLVKVKFYHDEHEQEWFGYGMGCKWGEWYIYIDRYVRLFLLADAIGFYIGI